MSLPRMARGRFFVLGEILGEIPVFVFGLVVLLVILSLVTAGGKR